MHNRSNNFNGRNMYDLDFMKACDSVRRKVLYNILSEFGIPMKLVRLMKMCLPETYNSPGRQEFVWHVSY